jgi:Tfp pilus assembly protein PilN
MIEINLLPKEYRKKTFDFSLGKVGVYAVVGIAGIILMLAGVTIYQSYQISTLESSIEKAGQRAATLQKDIRLVDALTEVKGKISGRMTAVERLDTHRSTWVRVLENMAGTVPDFVWLSRFTETPPIVEKPKKAKDKKKSKGKKNEVVAEPDTLAPPVPVERPTSTLAEIEGHAFTLNSLATLMINMMRSDYFDNVELLATNEVELEEQKAYNFILSCQVHFLSDDDLRRMVAQAEIEAQSELAVVDHKQLN